jgi:hypothetical protein
MRFANDHAREGHRRRRHAGERFGMNKAIRQAIEQAGIQRPPDPTDGDWKRYAELLEHCEVDEVAELAALIRKCGRRPADVQTDTDAVATARRHCQTFAAGCVRPQIDAAVKAIEDHDAETERLVSQLRQERRRQRDGLQGELDGLNQLRALAKEAAAKLRELKQSRPLLAHVDYLDVKQLEP